MMLMILRSKVYFSKKVENHYGHNFLYVSKYTDFNCNVQFPWNLLKRWLFEDFHFYVFHNFHFLSVWGLCLVAVRPAAAVHEFARIKNFGAYLALCSANSLDVQNSKSDAPHWIALWFRIVWSCRPHWGQQAVRLHLISNDDKNIK